MRQYGDTPVPDAPTGPPPTAGTARPASESAPSAPPIPAPPPSDDQAADTVGTGPHGARTGRGPARLGPARRRTLASIFLVVGLGLVTAGAAGMWLPQDPDAPPAAVRNFQEARALWRQIPVDELFPPTLRGDGAGPGRADRRWIRVAVASDSGCAAGLDPKLVKELAPVGCHRLVRASYVDETRSTMTTVGLVFTEAEAAEMEQLRDRFASGDLHQRTDMLPRAFAERGTPVAAFGDAQRASWTTRVLTDAPVIVFAVTGFGDGRTVTQPQPAEEAVRKGQTTPAAQAGLGHTAKGIADRIERALRGRVAEIREGGQ